MVAMSTYSSHGKHGTAQTEVTLPGRDRMRMRRSAKVATYEHVPFAERMKRKLPVLNSLIPLNARNCHVDERVCEWLDTADGEFKCAWYGTDSQLQRQGTRIVIRRTDECVNDRCLTGKGVPSREEEN